MTKPGHDPDGVAKTEIDRVGNCSFCGALVDMCDMGQILAHLHEAEIEIGEGPPIARKIPTLTPKPNCSLIAAANPQGDTDARSGFGDIGDRGGLNSRAGGGPNLRPRAIRFACTCTNRPPTTNAATRRCLSATRRHRAARHSASSIHISRARKSPRVIGGIAASTKAYFGA
jgi:hypothetical protein